MNPSRNTNTHRDSRESKIQTNYPHNTVKFNDDGSINSFGKLNWLVQCAHSQPWLKFVATGLRTELLRLKLQKKNITEIPHLIRDQLLGSSECDILIGNPFF